MTMTSISHTTASSLSDNSAKIPGKFMGLATATLATLIGALLIPASLMVAGFTLWGLSMPDYPPPLFEKPWEWVWNFFSISMPLAVSTVIIGVWVSYRIRMYFLFGTIYGLLWIPGMSKVMSLF